MTASMQGFLWLLLALGPLLFLQSGLQREVQLIFLILTRRADLSAVLFALVFFPGVLLHESSHYLMARVLGVPTGRFSLIPQPLPDGRLRLGYVETAKADWLREALIGAAPLITGGLFVAYVGLQRLDLMRLLSSIRVLDPAAFIYNIYFLPRQEDFWLWFYLALTVSSTMMPSASDRRAWLPLGMMLAVVFAALFFAGAGEWLAAALLPGLYRAVQSVALVFVLAVLLHLFLLIPLGLMRRLLARLLGLQVS